MKKAFVALVLAAAVAVYATMLLWSLPALTAIASANGLADARMFDMRPGGYDFATAKAILAALGEAGRAQYRDVQQRLDTAFPLLNGLSMYIGLTFVGRRLNVPGAVASAVAAALAFAVAGFDVAENALVARMLDAGPEGLTPEMVAAASHMSVLKSASVTAASTLLLAGLAAAAYRQWSKRS